MLIQQSLRWFVSNIGSGSLFGKLDIYKFIFAYLQK